MYMYIYIYIYKYINIYIYDLERVVERWVRIAEASAPRP